MNMLADKLMGRIAVYLGSPARLANERPELVPTLTRGRPAEALPGLLSALFSMCAHAHRVTAQRAVQAAMGQLAPWSHAQARQLQMETLREHLRRLWMDWPRQLWGGQALSASAMQALATCPAMLPLTGAQEAESLAQLDALRPWLVEHVFQQPLADWLKAWEADGEVALAAWCESATTLPARLMADARPFAQAKHQPLQPLHVEDGPALRELAGRLASQPGHARAPEWLGQRRETGPWSRAHGLASCANERSLWWRMGGRLADLARLALQDAPADTPDGQQGPCGIHVLQTGAVQLDAHSAIAWTEMARGTLLHWVRLADQPGPPVVADCQVVSPTEWNFHADGQAAQLLCGAAVDKAQQLQRAALLAMAYDPCVALSIVQEDGLTMQRCPPLAQQPHPAQEASPCMN